MATVAQFDHPNPMKLVSSWASVTEIQMMFELMDGSLKDFYTDEKNVIAHIAQQILMGLSYLRDKRIVHRYLKLANVLRNNDDNVKIADFGLSRSLDIDKSDVWSLGILLLEIDMGHFLFPRIDKLQTYNEIINDFIVPELPNSTSQFRDFVQRCLIRDIDSRASVDDLLGHNFLHIFH
nr:mitogen-activated protein kinase kinase 4-like [Coffea arabica]